MAPILNKRLCKFSHRNKLWNFLMVLFNLSLIHLWQNPLLLSNVPSLQLFTCSITGKFTCEKSCFPKHYYLGPARLERSSIHERGSRLSPYITLSRTELRPCPATISKVSCACAFKGLTRETLNVQNMALWVTRLDPPPEKAAAR